MVPSDITIITTNRKNTIILGKLSFSDFNNLSPSSRKLNNLNTRKTRISLNVLSTIRYLLAEKKRPR